MKWKFICGLLRREVAFALVNLPSRGRPLFHRRSGEEGKRFAHANVITVDTNNCECLETTGEDEHGRLVLLGSVAQQVRKQNLRRTDWFPRICQRVCRVYRCVSVVRRPVAERILRQKGSCTCSAKLSKPKGNRYVQCRNRPRVERP
jgi:hypothetical protein